MMHILEILAPRLPVLVVWFAATANVAALGIYWWRVRKERQRCDEWLTEAQGGPRRGR